MNKKLMVPLVGIVLGGVTFAAGRLLYSEQSGSDRFIMLIMSAYIIIGLLLSWRLAYATRPGKTADQTDTQTMEQESKDRRRPQPITPFGYSFFIAVIVILLLDYLIR